MVKKTLLCAAGALALAVGALLAINFRDEALDADAAKVLERSEAMAPVAANAYVYATGFFAPPNEDPYARGETLLAAYAAASRAGDAKAAQKAILRQGEGELSTNLAKLPCNVANEDCIAQAREKPESLQAKLEGVVAARCTALHALSAWAETYVPDHVTAPFNFSSLNALSICQRVGFARAALELQAGQGEEALARVLSGMEFERRALGGSVTLMGKMAAAAALRGSMLFLSDLMRNEPRLAAAKRGVIARALRPLAAHDRSLASAMRAEFRLMARTVREFDTGKSSPSLPSQTGEDVLNWLGTTPLHRANATLNRAWPTYRDLIEAERLPASAFGEAAKKLREAPARLAAPSADWVYNPVGKLLLAISVPELSGHLARMHDVDALARLVAAQARIARGSDEATIRQLLGDAALANPYTGKPMEFDPSARTLSFATQYRYFSTGKRWGGDGHVTVRLPGSTPR